MHIPARITQVLVDIIFIVRESIALVHRGMG